MSIKLTEEQDDLVNELVKWYRKGNSAFYSYSGPAGSGKTTVIHRFIKKVHLDISQVAAAAYVGKAVLVLMRQGLIASTIHSLIYHTVIIADKYNLRPDGTPKTKMIFELKKHLDDHIKLIIIDEAPMVNDAMVSEILSFGIPTIFVGDNNQLPPVFGKSSVMDNPDYTLTKVMRQKENDPIIKFSQDVLHNRPLIPGQYGKSLIVTHLPFDESWVTDYDCIICAKNKTRDMVNNMIRSKILHIQNEKPVIGDKIICRQNDWSRDIDGIPLTNGLIGHISNIDYSTARLGYLLADMRPDFTNKDFENLEMDYSYITSPYEERKSYGLSPYNKFEYGYAITSHLSQGSTIPRVLYLDEGFWDKEMLKKVRYTAITRASEYITICKYTMF